MNQDKDNSRTPGPEEDWFGRELSRHELPSARDGFRQELKDSFRTGEFAERETCEVFRSELRERFVKGRLDKRPIALRVLQYIGPLAAAAVLILTQLPSSSGDSREWEVLEVVRDASILGSIADWQEIHTGKDRLRLGYGADVFVEIGANSLVERSQSDGSEKFTASEGSLVFTTPEGGEPITFWIETPDAVIQVTANSVGVDLYEGGTCVCVLEGEVTVTPRVGERESHSIGPGRSCFVQKDGVVLLGHEAEEMHVAPIRALKALADL